MTTETVRLDALVGQLQIPKTHGKQVAPGVFLIGEPTPRPGLGDNSLACLADVHGMLCVVELSVRLVPNAELTRGVEPLDKRSNA